VEQVFTSSLEVDPALRDMKIFKVCRMWTERSFRQLEDGDVYRLIALTFALAHFFLQGSDAYPYDACILTSDIEDLKSKVTNMTVEARSLYLTEQMTFLERWRKVCGIRAKLHARPVLTCAAACLSPPKLVWS
jgi:hypothetical protein